MAFPGFYLLNWMKLFPIWGKKKKFPGILILQEEQVSCLKPKRLSFQVQNPADLIILIFVLGLLLLSRL